MPFLFPSLSAILFRIDTNRRKEECVQYEIIPVEDKKGLASFILFPYQMYRKDPCWVAPLLAEEKKKLTPETNAMLKHCDVQLFILKQGAKTIGRISAFVDTLAVDHWKKPIGLFGSFECIDDSRAAGLLVDTARDWLKAKGMESMRGPWSFASQEWGCMIEGFHSPPMIMAPYNPVYYDSLLEGTGLKKAKDLLVYGLDAKNGYALPERFIRFTDMIGRKTGARIRPVDMKRLSEDVEIIIRMANESTSRNWGYVPVTGDEGRELASSLKMIIDPELVMIGEIQGRPVGYLIALPDINVILKPMKGHLFHPGIFKLLFGVKKVRDYRIWALGVIPEYQRKAIDTLFYRKLTETLQSKKPGPSYVEANYVLEDNMPMNNPILKMGFSVVKKYRVYETGI